MDRKRTRITQNVEIVEAERESEVILTKTVFQYLSCLFTYCVAWARAGCKPLNPENKDKETRATDSCTIVAVPLDVMMAYHDRAHRQVCKMLMTTSEAHVLDWLIAVDEEERAVWVDQSRHSDLTFGKIVKQAMQQREASWEPPKPGSSGGGGGSPMKKGDGGGGQQQRGDVSPQKKQVNLVPAAGPSGQTVKAKKDGRAICQAWNKGGCVQGRCPKNEDHVCSMRMKNGRACGMKNHNATQCHNPRCK